MLAELINVQIAPVAAEPVCRVAAVPRVPVKSRSFDVPPDRGGWAAASHHRWQAATQLHARLWAAVRPGSPGVDTAAFCMPGLVVDEALQAEVHAVFGEAALLAGLSHAREVSTALRLLTGEQACIESLRGSVLGRLQAMVRDLAIGGATGGAISGATGGAIGGRTGEPDMPFAASDTVLGRRMVTALQQMQDRFDAADGVTEDVLAAIGNIALAVRLLRSHRDEIQQAARQWTAVLDAHEAAWRAPAPG